MAHSETCLHPVVGAGGAERRASLPSDRWPLSRSCRWRVAAGGQASAEQFGLEHEYLSADEVHERFAQFEPTADCATIYDPGSGYIQPEQTVRVQLRLAEKHGADLRFHVLEIVEGTRGVRLRTDRGVYHAGRVVVASGCWAPALLPDLGVRIRVLRNVMLWFDQDGGAHAFQPDRFPRPFSVRPHRHRIKRGRTGDPGGQRMTRESKRLVEDKQLSV